MNDQQNKKQQVLVIGGGVGGLCGALMLAELDVRVVLVEKSPVVGGILNQLDLQFPNDHCGICRMLPMVKRDGVSQFCVRRGIFHEAISVFTRTRVTAVSGTPGNFKASLETDSPGVDPEKCVNCGACIEICPVTVPDDFNGGLSGRKAVYHPVPFGIPESPVMDWQSCTLCGACKEACSENAIVLEKTVQKIELEGICGIMDATGVALANPADFDVYGHGVLKNVLTATAFERLLSSSGPFEGKPVRPSDGKPIEKIAWLQCVGSRNIMIGADFCSSACCMFALKEAVLAREKIGESVKATIFYMDMRTYGRDFQRYRDRAEKDHHVRLVRCRVHSIEPADAPGDLKISFIGPDGGILEENFDVAVLSMGQKAGLKNLMATLGLTSVDGVETLDSVLGLKDISATVLSAGKAASRIMAGMAGARDKRKTTRGALEKGPEGFHERPRIGVAACLSDSDEEDVRTAWKDLAKEIPLGFFSSRPVQDHWASVAGFVQENKLNRLVVVSEKPYQLWPGSSELFLQTGLIASRVDFVDLHLLTEKGQTPSQKAQTAVKAVEMAVNRLRSRKAQTGITVDVTQSALVVGAGPAGLSAAKTMALCGMDVTLIEKTAQIGGNAKNIIDPEVRTLTDQLISDVENHGRIRILKNTVLEQTNGSAGNFQSLLVSGGGEKTPLEHGVMIVATGGQASDCAAYEYGSSDLILNQFDLEKQLANPNEAITKLKSVAMIQCAGSREEPRNYCSRICCVKALKNAIRLKEITPRADITLWYRDIMTYGENEKLYTRARQAGVLFVPFDPKVKPRVCLVDHRPLVKGFDPVLQEALSLKPDLLVLSSGISPHAVDINIRGSVLETTRDGFLKEADSKWRPVDSGREGVFICGLARNPVNAKEAMDEGEAAAQRALRILFQNRLVPQRIAARVRPAVCSLCELCIESCVYGARRFDPESNRIVVDPAACQGCGACAALCPNSATVIGDFEDNGIMDAIEAALD